MKKHFSQVATLVLCLVTVAANTTLAQTDCTIKKGIGTWANPVLSNSWMDSLGLTWYYNWSPKPMYDYNGALEFVPMIWGAGDALQANADSIRNSKATCVLGFNEPDDKGQSNMTVQQAIDLWPIVESTGKRIGSPAQAGPAYQDSGWLDQFMTQAKAKKYRVDFIALHIYQLNNTVQNLLDYVRKVHDKYKLPIWITEWSLVDWNALNQPTFSAEALYLMNVGNALAKLEYVERYSWFAMWDGHSAGQTWRMYMVDDTSKKITVIGKTMRDLCGEGNRNLVTNPSFEYDDSTTQNPTAWSTWASRTPNEDYTQLGSHSGKYELTQWLDSDYQVYTYQDIQGLDSGFYSLRAWVKSSGGQKYCSLSAKNYGGADRNVGVPKSDSWVQLTVPNIRVTNGACEIAFWSDAHAGEWMNADDIEFIKQPDSIAASVTSTDITPTSTTGLIYPTPFSESVTIPLSMRVSAPVQLAIYSLTGERIRIIDFGSFTAGDHSLNWDGRDAANHIAPDGVYLFHIKVGTDELTGRIVKVKP